EEEGGVKSKIIIYIFNYIFFREKIYSSFFFKWCTGVVSSCSNILQTDADIGRMNQTGSTLLCCGGQCPLPVRFAP
ncbi:MAG: hypothetical protein IJ060_11890, partial [Oscillospiraceae bacterium]|nr:hypothetical protein [Oscillospiraceae bacterium]